MSLILIADDSASNRELLRTMLNHAGHQVTEAEDGEQAVAQARITRPDLAIIDIQMPKLDGYGVLQQLRADDGLRHIPVIALTAYAMDGDRARGLSAGFHAYVTKPVTLRNLRDILREVLPEKQ
jgi:CheY-like chemotaxis protein